jgi:hypothetical protein
MKNYTRPALAPLPFGRRSLVLPLALAALAFAAIPVGALFAQAGQAPYTVTETGKDYARLQDAVNAIGSGKGTISIVPGRYADCAVQTEGDVTFLAAQPGSAVFDGLICEDKAALVFRGRSATVSGLVFQNMKSPYSGNGAGIRIERGNLTVAQSWFKDSQQGILSANDPSGRIVVDKSTFTRLGTCEFSAGCAHSIYIGHYGHLRVTRTRFEQGSGGHYLKSRSARVEIASNSFDDSNGKYSNYMIDLPAGSNGQITNNWFVQGPHHENHSALIAIAAESHDNSANGLQIAGNDARLAPSVDWTTVFVADWSGDQIALGENRLGAGIKRFERR